MNSTSPRSVQGFTLIEVMIAMVVMIVVVAGGAVMVQRDLQRQENAATGDWLRVIARAARAYEAANTASLLAAAGPTTPASASAAQLVGLLPPGFSTTGPQGHTFTVRWIEPTAGKLDGLILLQGGDVLSGMSLLQVAGQAGAGAGYVDPQNTAQGRGPRGTWTVPLASWGGSPGAGKPLYALFYDKEAAEGTSANDYLNRTAVAGKPELNRMSTSIDLANNNINNGANIGAQNVDAANGVRANQFSIGKSDFGATPWPYETIQLNSGYNMRFALGTREHMLLSSDASTTFHGNINAQTFNGTNVSVGGDVNANRLLANEIVGYGSVQGQEVYANGWFRSRGGGGWYSEQFGGGWHMTDPTWIRAYNGKNVYTTGEMRAGRLSSEGDADIGGGLRAGGRADVNDLMIRGVASEGAGCGEWGQQARTPNGKLLSCDGGVWRGGGGGITHTTIVQSIGTSNGSNSVYATCPAGYYLTGGGYLTAFMQKASSQEAPQINMPQGNSWVVMGGSDNSAARESRFYGYAVCAK